MRTPCKIDDVQEVDHHRNGIGGESFYVIRFRYTEDGKTRNMFAAVFDTPAHIAVFDMDLLAEGIIGFPQNSWRGDYFEYEVRDAIRKFEEKRRAAYAEPGFPSSHNLVDDVIRNH